MCVCTLVLVPVVDTWNSFKKPTTFGFEEKDKWLGGGEGCNVVTAPFAIH